MQRLRRLRPLFEGKQLSVCTCIFVVYIYICLACLFVFPFDKFVFTIEQPVDDGSAAALPHLKCDLGAGSYPFWRSQHLLSCRDSELGRFNLRITSLGIGPVCTIWALWALRGPAGTDRIRVCSRGRKQTLKRWRRSSLVAENIRSMSQYELAKCSYLALQSQTMRLQYYLLTRNLMLPIPLPALDLGTFGSAKGEGKT